MCVKSDDGHDWEGDRKKEKEPERFECGTVFVADTMKDFGTVFISGTMKEVKTVAPPKPRHSNSQSAKNASKSSPEHFGTTNFATDSISTNFGVQDQLQAIYRKVSASCHNYINIYLFSFFPLLARTVV